jgi:hypothetical protein
MNDVFRLIRPDGGQHKGTSSCKHQSCSKTTREAKPYCSDHIESSCYVQKILDELKRRDAEEAILNKERGKLPKDGFFYRETLLLLRSKDFTVKGLARRLDLSHAAAARLIRLMDRDGLARKNQTSRGELTISGLGARDLAAPEE